MNTEEDYQCISARKKQNRWTSRVTEVPANTTTRPTSTKMVRVYGGLKNDGWSRMDKRLRIERVEILVLVIRDLHTESLNDFGDNPFYPCNKHARPISLSGTSGYDPLSLFCMANPPYFCRPDLLERIILYLINPAFIRCCLPIMSLYSSTKFTFILIHDMVLKPPTYATYAKEHHNC